MGFVVGFLRLGDTNGILVLPDKPKKKQSLLISSLCPFILSLYSFIIFL